jgi:hypothetical protein
LNTSQRDDFETFWPANYRNLLFKYRDLQDSPECIQPGARVRTVIPPPPSVAEAFSQSESNSGFNSQASIQPKDNC